MISFPNCKINLGLNILAKRTDGYHDLQTVFVPVPVEDCLEIERSSAKSSLSVTGITLDTPSESNLCWKAYQLLTEKYQLPPVEIKLYKQVPAGSGLGAGSSDGAFTLRLLNEKFNLKLEQSDLIQLASQLGSDCPFFIINKPCVGSGRGDILTPIELPQLKDLFGLIIIPGIHISSAWAFQQITIKTSKKPISKIIESPITEWKQNLFNDFEESVFQSYPDLKIIKERLYQAGALYASLSGSGSAMYGLFTELPKIDFQPEYLIKSFSFNQRET